MRYYILLLKYYPPRNYFLRIFQFLFWFLSHYYNKTLTFEKLSITISDSRAIMNLFSILEKVYDIFSKSKLFKESNKIQKLLYFTYITSFCHISLHSICFITNLCGYNFSFLEYLFNAFYTCTMLINLIRYKIELDEIYKSNNKTKINEEKKEREKIIKLGVLAIGFNLPLAVNGTGLIKVIHGFKFNKQIEGFLGFFASIIQFYVAASNHLKEIKNNYINNSKKNE